MTGGGGLVPRRCEVVKVPRELFGRGQWLSGCSGRPWRATTGLRARIGAALVRGGCEGSVAGGIQGCQPDVGSMVQRHDDGARWPCEGR